MKLKILVTISPYDNWPRVGKPDTTISAVDSWGQKVCSTARWSRACNQTSTWLKRSNVVLATSFSLDSSPLMCVNMNSYIRDILASLSKLLNHDISSETVAVCGCCCGTEGTLTGIVATCWCCCITKDALAPETAPACRCCWGKVSWLENEKSGVGGSDGVPLAVYYSLVLSSSWGLISGASSIATLCSTPELTSNPDTRVHSPDDMSYYIQKIFFNRTIAFCARGHLVNKI